MRISSQGSGYSWFYKYRRVSMRFRSLPGKKLQCHNIWLSDWPFVVADCDMAGWNVGLGWSR
jgi:hypothetical protein